MPSKAFKWRRTKRGRGNEVAVENVFILSLAGEGFTEQQLAYMCLPSLTPPQRPAHMISSPMMNSSQTSTWL